MRLNDAASRPLTEAHLAMGLLLARSRSSGIHAVTLGLDRSAAGFLEFKLGRQHLLGYDLQRRPLAVPPQKKSLHARPSL